MGLNCICIHYRSSTEKAGQEQNTRDKSQYIIYISYFGINMRHMQQKTTCMYSSFEKVLSLTNL